MDHMNRCDKSKLSPTEMKKWAAESISRLADVEIKNPVTTWQSNTHLPQRRMMIQRLMLTMQHRNGLLVPPHVWSEKLPGLVRRIELSLYVRAASLREYMNHHTLKRRVQCLVITLHRQGLYYKATKSCNKETKSRDVFRPSNNLNTSTMDNNLLPYVISPKVGVKRKPLQSIPDCQLYFGDKLDTRNKKHLFCRQWIGKVFKRRNETSQRFLQHNADIVSHVFEFLDGHEVTRNRTLNRFFNRLLPSCVLYLQLELSELKILLDKPYPGGILGTFPRLEELKVYNRNAILNDYQNPVNHLMTDGCPQLPFNCTNEGEAIIHDLAVGLMARSNPRLRVLSICSNFVNTCNINSISAIVCALKSGCCPDLKVLRLGGNSIGDSGALAVAGLLLSNSCKELEHLDLRKNFIGESGIVGIAGAIALGFCSNLKLLCLGGNIITDAGAIRLAQCLRYGKAASLTFLGLEHNFMEDDGILMLAHVLKSSACPLLKELRLGENAISNAKIQMLFYKAMNL